MLIPEKICAVCKARVPVRMYRTVSTVVIFTVLVVVMFVGIYCSGLYYSRADGSCAAGDRPYSVQSGDTLGSIAQSYQTSWQKLASYNGLNNPDVLYVNQVICIPSGNSVHVKSSGSLAALSNQPAMTVQNSTSSQAPVGVTNLFPYGQCTWWANERYYELHNVFVPWTINSDAYQWVQRAHDFNWSVSSVPTAGSIIVISPFLQEAGSVGHVGVVESILPGGHVVVSNMNWSDGPGIVMNVEFIPGPGIYFITR